jgi:hypothetical protein
VVHGRPNVVHVFQFSGGPQVVPTIAVHPWRLHLEVPPGPLQITHQFQFFSGPSFNTVGSGSFPGFGPAGSATLLLSLEQAKLTLSWSTDIFKSYSGREQRCDTTGPRPRQRFEGLAFLLDGPGRDVRSALQRAASQGSTFLLALPYEELATTADSTGTILTVASTASADWAIVTQRVAIEAVDGSTLTAVIQAVTPTTIQIDVAPSVTAGARIMPLIQVLLDPQQGFSRYPVNVELWSIRALASAFGWVGQDSMGLGARIATYTAGVPVDATTLTDDDLLIWNRSNAVDGTSTEAMLSLAETVDLGALPYGIGGADVPDWARPIRYMSADPGDWQWFKAFVRQLRGRQRAFLLSTNHADLLYVSTLAGGKIKVSSAGDYASWWTSQAHRRLAIAKTDGSTQYVAVISAPVDNGDGTLTLTLDAVVTGAVSCVSFLEQVRLDNNDSDDISVTWDGGTFVVDLLARTVQDSISVDGPMAGVTRDATSGVFVPASASEWATVLAVAGITGGAPGAVYGFQESSGSLTDAVGGFTGSRTGTAPTYQVAVTGWSRKSILLADNETTSFTNASASLPDVSTTSASILLYAMVATPPPAARALAGLGTTFIADGVATSGGASSLRITGVGGFDGSINSTGAVHPTWLTINRTASSETLVSDLERITPSFSGAPTGKQIRFGSSSNPAAACNYLYAAVFFGAAAELTQTQQKAILQTLGWSVAW